MLLSTLKESEVKVKSPAFLSSSLISPGDFAGAPRDGRALPRGPKEGKAFPDLVTYKTKRVLGIRQGPVLLKVQKDAKCSTLEEKGILGTYKGARDARGGKLRSISEFEVALEA